MVLEKENLGDRIFINQADLAPEKAMRLKTLLSKPCVIGSVMKGDILC